MIMQHEYWKTVKVRDEKKLTSIPNKKYLKSALNKLEMGDRNGVCLAEAG